MQNRNLNNENYSKAFDLVKNNDFGIIICDVTEDSFITEDFILTYSKTNL